MNSFINELGVIDKLNKVHRVKLKQGLNVITGRSSTGKSALIEIFDYCFGSGDSTIPKGVITKSAKLYYVYLTVNDETIVIGRKADDRKAFFRREETYDSDKINIDYFVDTHFMPLGAFKKHLRSLFLDIDDVDDSLIARENRYNNSKAPTPSIRSFVSFMLQHQNLVANKHALFYRFDEKEKRDQVIGHTKIFLSLVDQKFFHYSQEKERLTYEIKKINREIFSNEKVVERRKNEVEPVLRKLYAEMGFKSDPISLLSMSIQN